MDSTEVTEPIKRKKKTKKEPCPEMDSTEVTEPIKRKIKTEEEPCPELDSTEVTEPIKEEPKTEKESCPEVLVIGNNWVKYIKSYWDLQQDSVPVDFVYGRRFDLNKIISRLTEVIRPSHLYLVVFGLLLEGYEEVKFRLNKNMMRPRPSFSLADTLKKIIKLSKVARCLNPDIILIIELPPIFSLKCYNDHVLRSAPKAVRKQYAADNQFSTQVLWDESLKRYNEMLLLQEPLAQLGINVLLVTSIQRFHRQVKTFKIGTSKKRIKYLKLGIYPNPSCAKMLMLKLFQFVRKQQWRQKRLNNRYPPLNNREISAFMQTSFKVNNNIIKNNKIKRNKKRNLPSSRVEPGCSVEEPTSNGSTDFVPSPQQIEPEIDRFTAFIRGIASASGSHEMTEEEARLTLLKYLISRPSKPDGSRVEK